MIHLSAFGHAVLAARPSHNGGLLNITFDGKPVNEFDVHYKGDKELTINMYVGASSGLPVGYRLTSTANSRVNIARYTDMVIDGPIAQSKFVMNLPKSAKPAADIDYSATVVALGSNAPSCSATSVTGGKVNLYELASGSSKDTNVRADLSTR
jgi:hypothetical protein